MALRQFTDQLNRTIEISFPPKRIISLVPSQTELLFTLGLDDEVVGITKFCIHPLEKFKAKPKIGGTKQLNIEAIRKLSPDLIIGNKEENEKEQIEQLMQEFPVWMSDINGLEDALQMIVAIGSLTGKSQPAKTISNNIRTGFEELQKKPANKLKVAYLIWKNPFMIAGKGTFINEMIERTGWENAIGLSRYPEINEQQLNESKPDLILLSSEPYPFTEKHIDEFRAICPKSHIKIIDGELFCWYGSRLMQTPEYLYSLKQQFDTLKTQ